MAGSGSLQLQQTRSLAMTRQLGQAIGLLKMSNRQLSDFLLFHLAANPYLTLEAPARSAGDAGQQNGRGTSERDPTRTIENLPALGSGLEEYVRREIGCILTSARERTIAEVFIEALEPTGWLGRPVDEIAEDAGCSPDEAEAVLVRIQGISPTGMFARNLAECLRLQAEEAGVLNGPLEAMLRNLPVLARGDFEELAEICCCTRARVLELFETIRSFNPKPATMIDAETVVEVPPDLIVTDDGVRLEVSLNRSLLPTVSVCAGKGVGEADRRMLEAARSVARAVERRNVLTLQIAADLVRRQAEFLRKGLAHLKPLSLHDVAQGLGVSESTVSRVTSGLRMDAPRGTVALKDFFSGALPGREGDVSPAAVREIISALVSAEDSAHPVSDTTLMEQLDDRGIRVARRTVAKYRQVLRIPGSSERRAVAARRRR